MQSWLLPLLALALAFIVLAAREASAQAVDPIPTMSSTSWVAPGWTPTMQPWPPRTPTPTPYVVWLTEVQR